MKKTIRVIALALCVAMLAIPVMAAENFTPSVTQKPAPAIKPMTDAKGNEVAGVIKDAEGNEIEGISAEEITVVPVSESEQMSKEEKETMEKAYNEIAETEDLTKVAPKLEDALKEINKGRKDEIKAEDLVVRDLVDVKISARLLNNLKDGDTVSVKFELDIQEDETLIVMQLIDGEWIIIYGEDILIDEDGNAIVALAGSGPVAFIVK